MTDFTKKAYDIGGEIRAIVALSDVDPIHHIQEVDDVIASALSEAYEAGRKEEREACARIARLQPILSTGREGMVGQLGMQGRIVDAIRKSGEATDEQV